VGAGSDELKKRLLLLVQHGHTNLDAAGQTHGWLQTPLNAQGRAHAARGARELPPLKDPVVVSSDRKRAFQTAEIIANHLHAPLKSTPALRPWNAGKFAGADEKVAKDAYDASEATGEAPEGGEPVSEYQKRWAKGQAELRAAAAKHDVVAVTHSKNIKDATGKKLKPGGHTRI
jgi:broad specificity phosphatase PhoE